MDIKQLVVKEGVIYGIGSDDNRVYRWNYSQGNWVPYWQTNQQIGNVPLDDSSES